MPEWTPVPILFKAGIKRDGTQFEGNYCVDGKWCRFLRNGLPAKINGYRRLSSSLQGPPRELHNFNKTGYTYAHNGHQGGIERVLLDSMGNVASIVDRTPAGFTVDVNNDWQIEELFDATGSKTSIIAHAAPNLVNIDNATAFPYYVGDIDGVAALTVVAATDCSGGVCTLHPYVVRYSSDGFIGWSVPNKPADIVGAGSGNARVTGQKIIKGLPLRGGSQAPAGIFWSIDAIIRCYFVGTTAGTFAFDEITNQASILSANSVIEYDGIYYWIGVDRFMMYNGVIQEVPNFLNLDFFFDNLNYGYRGKVYAFKVTRRGEIWFCAPLFGATEPNWAVIYNVRLSQALGYPVWYDTPLPDSGRGAAAYATVLQSPLMTGVDVASGTYSLWQHEYGVDRVDGANAYAVESYFETADMMYATMQAAPELANKAMHCEFIEPDFVQIGDMTVQVSGRVNARSPQVYSNPVSFPASAAGDSFKELVPMREERRQMRFKFSSNVAGGYYQMGQALAHIGPAEGRIRS